MKAHIILKRNHTLSRSLQISCLPFLLTALFFLAACSKSSVQPTPIAVSPSGQLSRYDLASSDYDVLPVTTFTISFDNDGKISNLFEKTGQTLHSFNLNYNGNKLIRSMANNLGVQSITYNTSGKPAQVDFNTLTDTGKRVFNYNASGKLMSIVDSLKQPLKLALRYQYLFTYDATGNNVSKITKNQLDLSGRPTLRQYNLYTFDNQKNPFIAFPYLLNASNLPGDVPALINKNNITSTHIIGTIINTSAGGSVPTLDTITIYRASRSYEYNVKGFPSKTLEKFNDIQFNYSGNRTFTYEY